MLDSSAQVSRPDVATDAGRRERYSPSRPTCDGVARLQLLLATLHRRLVGDGEGPITFLLVFPSAHDESIGLDGLSDAVDAANLRRVRMRGLILAVPSAT
jgi:hypothetical protein